MTLINPDQFDIFADDDDAVERDISLVFSSPMLTLAADELTAFSIVTDGELAALSEEADERLATDDDAYIAMFYPDSALFQEAEERYYEDLYAYADDDRY